jgi:hypothetical protein
MMSGWHPRITGHDFALIEDTRRGTVVAATCLLAQRVTYEHLSFLLGRHRQSARVTWLQAASVYPKVWGVGRFS